MRPYDLILKKRNGEALTKTEIQFLISQYVDGYLADYQMAAFCMAVYFQGMTARETAEFTKVMADSGQHYDLKEIKGRVIDKHSTGGVGDTTTLVLAPLVAACGVPVAKMSGRGLGHTGGTIDKLASIPGLNWDLSHRDFVNQVNKIGLCIIGQSGSIAPADKQLYSLRDVTATVDSIPLIASSIMSKKIAAGASGFVLDVKFGQGGFMKDLEGATELAKTMVNIGKLVQKETTALITNMDQPLGFAIGNALEVEEAIQTLAGNGPRDLTELCLRLGAEMLVLAKRCSSSSEGYDLLAEKLRTKAGLAKFAQFISHQGGDERVIENLELLPKAKSNYIVRSKISGYIQKINAEGIGNIAMNLGAGRKTLTDTIDHSVGIRLNKKVGDYIDRDQPLAIIHSNTSLGKEDEQVLECFLIGPGIPSRLELVYEKITSFDV